MVRRAGNTGDKFREFVIDSSSGLWAPYYEEDENAWPEDALLDAQNVLPGTLIQRPGTQPFLDAAAYGGSNAGRIYSMHSYQKSAGTPELLYNYGTSLFTGTSRTTIETALQSGAPIEYTTFDDGKVYYVNGANSIRVYDGSTGGAVTAYVTGVSEPDNFLADVGDPIQTCTDIETHDGIIYVAGSRTDQDNYSTNANRLYRCDEVVGPTHWPSKVDVGDGAPIICLKSFNGVLVVFKSNSIHVVDGNVGDGSFRTRTIHRTIGTTHRRSVQEAPGLGLIFLGSDYTFYVLRPSEIASENAQLLSISSHIAKYVSFAGRNIDSGEVIGVADVRYGAGVWGNYYLVSVTFLTHLYGYSDSAMLVCDWSQIRTVQEGSLLHYVPWSIFAMASLPSQNCMVNHYNGTNILFLFGTTLYTEGTTKGPQIVYFTDWDYDITKTDVTGSLDYLSATKSSSPTITVETKTLTLGKPNYLKSVKEVVLNYRATNASRTVTPSVSVDEGAFTTLDTFDCTGGTFGTTASGTNIWKTGAATIPVNAYGKKFRFKFTSLGEKIEIISMKVRYLVIDDR